LNILRRRRSPGPTEVAGDRFDSAKMVSPRA